MQKYRVENAGEFAAWPEANMGIHFGRDADDENSIYVVIGTEVAVELAQLLSGDGEFEQLPDWRETSFRDWLPRASKRLRPMGSATARAVFGYAVAPVAPLPAAPARPAVIY